MSKRLKTGLSAMFMPPESAKPTDEAPQACTGVTAILAPEPHGLIERLDALERLQQRVTSLHTPSGGIRIAGAIFFYKDGVWSVLQATPAWKAITGMH